MIVVLQEPVFVDELTVNQGPNPYKLSLQATNCVLERCRIRSRVE